MKAADGGVQLLMNNLRGFRMPKRQKMRVATNTGPRGETVGGRWKFVTSEIWKPNTPAVF